MSKAASPDVELYEEQTADGATGGPSQEGSAQSVTTDDAFDLLSNQRRRYALHYLKYRDSRVELGELSEHVASWENDTTIREVDADERKRVYTSLQSHHLPKMDDEGVVEFDKRAGKVELTDAADDLELYLEVVHGKDVPWSQYYLGLAAVDSVLITAVFLNAWPLTVLPDVAWAAFVVTTLAVSAIVNIYHDSVHRLGLEKTPPEIRD